MRSIVGVGDPFPEQFQRLEREGPRAAVDEKADPSAAPIGCRPIRPAHGSAVASAASEDLVSRDHLDQPHQRAAG